VTTTGEPEPAAPPPARTGDDRRTALSAVFAFSFSLGLGSLALPLLAVASGYGATTVGLLAATSAVSQFVFRLGLPRLLARYPDRALIALACLTMASSYGMLLASTLLPVFVVAQLFQGGSRALFWTASQTHAVRSPGTAVQSLSMVGGIGNVSQMLGPLVTGVLATVSLAAPLIVGLVSGLTGAVIALRLIPYAPYAQRTSGGRGRMWRRPGVDTACWAGFVGGGWRALMSSYVPLVLTGAGLPTGTTGFLMSLADLTGTGVVFGMSRARVAHVDRTLGLSVGVTCIALALVPFAASSAVLAGLVLAVSGAGAAPITALAAASARQRVASEDEGEAIALVGTFRAGALLIAPAGVAIAVGSVALAPAFVVASLLLGVPTLVAGVSHRLAGREGAPA